MLLLTGSAVVMFLAATWVIWPDLKLAVKDRLERSAQPLQWRGPQAPK